MRNITLIPTMPYKVPGIEDVTDDLPKKGSWETLKNKRNTVKGVWDGTYHTGFRKPEDIETIVIHHSGPPEGSLISHANYHAKQWGAGISYHIAIDQGRIKQLNDLRSFTFHVSDHNTYTVAIVVNADLSKREMTSQERELLYAAILTVKSLLPIKHILGHNELNKTACPCTSMNRIRKDVEDLEKQIEFNQSGQMRDEMAMRIANVILWMYNTARGLDQYGKATVSDGDKEWAKNRLLLLEPVMREHEFIK